MQSPAKYTHNLEDLDDDMAACVAAVEDVVLKYRFKNKKLLEEALTHPSYTDAPNSYQRLEFLGDSILGTAMSSYVYLNYSDKDQGKLSLVRSANISTEKLARVAVHHQLYNYVRHNATALNLKVNDFVIAVEEENKAEVYGGLVKAPKVLADIVESVIAAVYIDCNFVLIDLWKIVRDFLEPIVMLHVLEQQPQPVTMLFELCQKDGKQVNLEYLKKGETSIASVFVDGRFVASASAEQKENAKLHAAKTALQKLSCDSMEINTCSQLNVDGEIDGAKQKLHELCGKKKWPKPNYKIQKEAGRAHEKRYVCSVEIEISEGPLFVTGDEKSRVKEAENSAASSMLLSLQNSKVHCPQVGKKRKANSLDSVEFQKLSMQSPAKYMYTLPPEDNKENQEIPDMAASVVAVENLLMYRFKNKKLLEEALTHSSYTDAASYQRLEFLGDSALCSLISSYVFLTYPDVDPGKLSLVRSANISTEKLARVAVRQELYKYVRHNATALNEKVNDFVVTVQEEDKAEVYGGLVKAPKVLADIVESVVAAVFIDCYFDLKDLWKIVRDFLEPIVMLSALEQQPQPVTRLYELCQKYGKHVDIKYWKNGERSIASVCVDGHFVASASAEQKENAKLHAAKTALQKLSYATGDSMEINTCSRLNVDGEIDGAKQKLHELCVKKKWPKPNYKIQKEVGCAHNKRYMCSVEIEIMEGLLFINGDEKSRVREAENSAASSMLLGLKDSKYL